MTEFSEGFEFKENYSRTIRNYTGFRLSFTEDAAAHRRLASVASHTKTSLFIVMVSVFVAMLSALSQSSKVIVASTLSLRESPNHFNVIGPAITVLPLFIEVKDVAFAELVANVNSSFLEMYALRFSKEYETEHIKGQAYNSAIAYHPIGLIPSQHSLNDNLIFSPYPIPVTKITTGLRFEIFEMEQGFLFNLDFSDELFSRDFAMKVVRRLHDIMQVVSANMDVHLSDVTKL